MTTNQTIDGVPRELLERLNNLTRWHFGNEAECVELRALLDAKRCDSCDDSGDLIDLTGEWRGYCVCPIGVVLKNKPVAQPQGEPVAWTEVDVLDFMSVALRHAEYSGLSPSDILDGLRFMAEKGKPAFVRAEQPAPVAVVLPERREPTHDNPYLSDADHEWNACLDELKRLNTK